jgi:hypothetical protein
MSCLSLYTSWPPPSSTAAADIRALWAAFFECRIVSPQWVRHVVRPRSVDSKEHMRYGLGFWLHDSKDVAILEGSDAGVSFRSVHDPRRRVTCTVLSNTSRGAWPIARCLDRLLMG